MTRTNSTFDNPGFELPAAEGCTRAVKHRSGSGHGAAHTRQCAICFATVTDAPILAAHAVNYANSPTDECFDGMDFPGTTEYGRCRDCRAAHRFLPGTRPDGYPWNEVNER